ncbi:thiolase-like protein, partial [Teratosphaeria nubilosa]
QEHAQPSTLTASRCGNMYTASPYSCFASLLCVIRPNELRGKRVCIFSYGLGLPSTLFALRIKGDTRAMSGVLNLNERLDLRVRSSPPDFVEPRRHAHLRRDFQPRRSIDATNAGSYYLARINDQ